MGAMQIMQLYCMVERTIWPCRASSERKAYYVRKFTYWQIEY